MKAVVVAVGVASLMMPAVFAFPPSSKPEVAPEGAGMPNAASEGFPIKGKVTQTMDAGRYTYVAVASEGGETWAAAPTFQVAVGDVVEIPAGIPMKSFHSKTLQRTFPLIYFVDGIRNVTRSPAEAASPECGKSCGHEKGAAAASKIALIAPPEGGKTVQEVIADRVALAGKTVKVRGKVVKFTPAIMGKNWLHLQDGSGPDGAADVAVTSDAVAKVGSVVTVSGTVVVDKDFGHGYRYSVLIENASIQ